MYLSTLLIPLFFQGAVSLPGNIDNEARRYRYRPHWPLTTRQNRNEGAYGAPSSVSTVSVTVQDCESHPAQLSSRAVVSSYPRSAFSNTTSTLADTPTAVSGDVATATSSSGVIQSVSGSQEPVTTGTIYTALETEGHPTDLPIITDPVSEPTTTIQTATITSTLDPGPTEPPMPTKNIFADPIATDRPPAAISARSDHPAPRVGVQGSGPIQTNKFFANFFLGSQQAPAYLFPYSVAWAGGKGTTGSWGLSISHIEASQRVFGEADPQTGAARYYINPVGIQSLCLSAKELGPGTTLTSDNITESGVSISLNPPGQGSPAIRFPLVQGSAFITALYNGVSPVIESGVYFKTVTRTTQTVKPGITKFRINLDDGTVWLLYAQQAQGTAPLDLRVLNNGAAQSNGTFTGVIQVAKDPGNAEALYDAACGAYSTGTDLSGQVDDSKGEYTFRFRKAGLASATLAMWALPHHQSSFSSATKSKMSDVELNTPTTGTARLVVADQWTMEEPDLPTGVAFVPWSPQAGSVGTLSSSAKAFIHNITLQELSQNMVSQSNQDSMYFSGKALAKFASIILAAKDLLEDEPLAVAGLNQLKLAFSRFAENQQRYPLVYESAWGGVVSSASYVTGDSGIDFGNSYYNDHHFHYGYFIYAAAVIGHLDPSWIDVNKAYVNTLVRDISNPSSKDTLFPVWRCFDWYHGHSWAHGLFETSDGKNQESSSEDSMHAYAIKMWGTVTGDSNMAARGNLMLAVQARSFNDYYLYSSSNKVQPPEFIGNKAAGILFENKIDHTTFFGTNVEYIQGIHMIPLLPHTPYVRKPDFVSEEWKTYFDSGRADQTAGGWKGILFGNLATVDPRSAYAFFSSPGFDPSWIDGGASLTWYLCYAAALGGL